MTVASPSAGPARTGTAPVLAGRRLSKRYGDLVALNDVDFQAADGEAVGIVGPNGAGKSTLLKLIAGIYPIDSGRIRTAGRVAPLIELGVGFRPELPARENIMINAVMMGLSRAEARDRISGSRTTRRACAAGWGFPS
jgi:ABC-type polysaccharide/polyol phosphate transport system ATPase subunit